MFRTVFAAWPLFIGVGLLLVGNGLQGTLLGVRATQEGFPTALTGIVMSAFYVGFLFGSLAAPNLIIRVGHIRVFAALSAIASAIVLLHAVIVDPWVWTVLRLISGFCYAGLYVVAESWLNAESNNSNRGTLLAAYMVVSLAGLSLGQLLLNVSDPSGFALFTLVSVSISIAVVPLLLTAGPVPISAASETISLSRLFEASPLGLVGTFAAGVGAGSILGVGAVYASLEGLAVRDVAFFMAGVTFSALLAQFPLGVISDRMDRRTVIVAVCGAATLAAILSVVLDGSAALAMIAVLGGLVLPLYSVAVAHTNDHLTSQELIAAAGGLMIAQGIGAALGPLAASLAMDLLDTAGFGLFFALVFGGMTLFGLARMGIRPAVPLADQGPAVYVARATPVATMLAQEEAAEQSTTEAVDEPRNEPEPSLI